MTKAPCRVPHNSAVSGFRYSVPVPLITSHCCVFSRAILVIVSSQHPRATLKTVHLSLRTLPLIILYCVPAWLLHLGLPPPSTNYSPISIVCPLAHSLTTRHAVVRIALRSHLYVRYLAESCPSRYALARLAIPHTTRRLLISISSHYPMNQCTVENKAVAATLPPMFSPRLALILNYCR
jgi:hypothetical protein